MQTFFLATKLSPESTRDASHIKENGRKWMEAVKRNCPGVKWREHYSLIGQYDFISVYEAPDMETAAKVSIITLASGAMKAESWPAIPYKDFLALVDSIQ